MEIAAVVRSVRLLDALAYPPDRGALPEEAEASTVASDTVRALIVAGAGRAAVRSARTGRGRGVAQRDGGRGRASRRVIGRMGSLLPPVPVRHQAEDPSLHPHPHPTAVDSPRPRAALANPHEPGGARGGPPAGCAPDGRRQAGA